VKEYITGVCYTLYPSWSFDSVNESTGHYLNIVQIISAWAYKIRIADDHDTIHKN